MLLGVAADDDVVFVTGFAFLNARLKLVFLSATPAETIVTMRTTMAISADSLSRDCAGAGG